VRRDERKPQQELRVATHAVFGLLHASKSRELPQEHARPAKGSSVVWLRATGDKLAVNILRDTHAAAVLARRHTASSVLHEIVRRVVLTYP